MVFAFDSSHVESFYGVKKHNFVVHVNKYLLRNVFQKPYAFCQGVQYRISRVANLSASKFDFKFFETRDRPLWKWDLKKK